MVTTVRKYGLAAVMVVTVLLISKPTLCAADAPSLNPIPPTQLALEVPSTWTVEKNQAGTVLIARSFLPIGFSGDAAERARGVVSVVVQSVNNEGPLAFAVRCRRDLERTIMGLVLDKSEEIELGSRKWVKQPYKMHVGQFTFQQVLYATVIDGQAVCITCSSESTNFTQWDSAFSEMLKSLARSRLQIDNN